MTAQPARPAERLAAEPRVRAARPLSPARSAYRDSKGLSELLGDWPAYLIFRPVSLWLTPACVCLGLRASAVTAAAALLALALPWAAVHHGPGAVVALGAGFQLLDCLDGDVARARGQASRRGDYGSMVVGQLYWVLLLLAFGLLAGRATALPWLAAHGAACGLGLGLLTVGGRLCREYVARQTGRPPLAAATAAPTSLRDWARVVASGLDNLYIAAIGLGAATHTLPACFLAVAAYCVALFAVVQKELVDGL